MFSTFYNESLRKLVIGFGSLFNNLNVRFFDSNGDVSQTVRVPISYAPKEKFIARLNEGGSILEDKTKVKAILPRIGFDITGINYDPTRTINKLTKTRKTDGPLTRESFNEVPYNVSFGLYTFTSSIDENLQLIEQITPFFTPEFNVTIKMNDLHTKVDVPIVLSNINIEENYEGDFFNRRFIATTFEFLAKSYVYGPIKTQGMTASGIITAITGDFYQSLDDTFDDESAVVASFGITGEIVGTTGTAGTVYYPAHGRTN